MKGAAAVPPRMTKPTSTSRTNRRGTSQYFFVSPRNPTSSPTSDRRFFCAACWKSCASLATAPPSVLVEIRGGILGELLGHPVAFGRLPAQPQRVAAAQPEDQSQARHHDQVKKRKQNRRIDASQDPGYRHPDSMDRTCRPGQQNREEPDRAADS